MFSIVVFFINLLTFVHKFEFDEDDAIFFDGNLFYFNC